MCSPMQPQIIFTFPSYLTGSLSCLFLIWGYSTSKNSKWIPVERDTVVMWRACVICCCALCQIEKFTVSPTKVSMFDTTAVLLPQHVIFHKRRSEKKKQKPLCLGNLSRLSGFRCTSPVPRPSEGQSAVHHYSVSETEWEGGNLGVWRLNNILIYPNLKQLKCGPHYMLSNLHLSSHQSN